MLPIVDKPIIQYGVEEALAAGCDQIIIITGRGKVAIEDHFDVSYELERILADRGKTDLLKIVKQISDMIHVAYVRQKEALGLGHAVLMAKELIGNEPFAVILADDVIDAPKPCLKQMVEFSRKPKPLSSPASSRRSRHLILWSSGYQRSRRPFQWQAFGNQTHGGKAEAGRGPSKQAIIGRYILTPAIFDVLEKTTPGAGGELQLTDAMRNLLQQERMWAYVYEGKRYDTGDKLGS